MGLFHGRPLAFGALLFMLSGALAFFCNLNLLFLGVIALVSAVIIAGFLLCHRKRSVPILLLILILVCGGFLRSYFYMAEFNRILRNYNGRTAVIEMTVNSVQYSLSYRSSCHATVTKIDDEATDFDVIFETGYDCGLNPGTAIRTYADISDFSQDEDGFKEKAYYNSKGIFLKATELEDCKFKILTENSSVNRLEIKAGQLRDKFTSLLDRYMPEKNGLPAAVFLGDRSALDEFDKTNFRRTGTYHLLALSGMHLSTLAAILDFILRNFAVSKGKRIFVTGSTILFYVTLTGFALSVVRAAIMLFISYLAYYVRREKDSLTSLLIAGAVICTASPCAISDVGFILSFATTFGIVAFYPTVEAKIIRARSVKFAGKAIYYILSSLGISAVALLFALPVSWLYFGKLAVLSPVGTLILSPLISALMLLTPLTLILGTVPYLGNALGHLTLWTSKGASHVAAFLAKPDGIEISLNYPFTPFFFVPFFALVLAIIFFRLKHLKFYFVSAIAIMLCFFLFHTVYVQNEPLSTQYLRRGENEYFIISKYGQNTVVDISDGSYNNLSYICTNAAQRGYCQIDVLVLTHYHQKHISSVSRLLKNQTVRQIILPQPLNKNETDILLSIADTAGESGIETHIFPLESGFTLFDETDVLLDRDYIKASTHPIVALELEGEVGLSYLGSSYASWHAVPDLQENVIVGTHGPVQKKEFYLPLPENIRLLSLADRDMAELMSKDCPMPPEDCKIFLNATLIKLK